MKKLKDIMATCLTAAALCMLPLPTLAQTLLEAGKTDVGVLYLDGDSVNTVKKDGKYYLAFFAEEKYTDQKFLASLRQGEDMQNAAGNISLYLFNTYGSAYFIGASYVIDADSAYFIGASYVIDADGNVCADLGADTKLKAVGNNKTLRNAYTMALKILERRNRGW